MKIQNNPIFYACFCFTILSINSCKAQNRDLVSSFFKKQKVESYNECLNNDDYKYFKKHNKKEAVNLTESSCKTLNIHYTHFSENTLHFLDSINTKNNKQDFIILNKTLRSDYSSKPVLTIFKAKGDNSYSVIHNYTSYDDLEKKFVILTDHSLMGFDAEKILKLFENYLYQNKKELISENVKDFSNTSDRLNLCYIIARVNGRFFINEYYYLDKTR